MKLKPTYRPHRPQTDIDLLRYTECHHGVVTGIRSNLTAAGQAIVIIKRIAYFRWQSYMLERSRARL